METSLKPKFLLGIKLGMTQIFKGDLIVPVTVIQAGPCTILGLRTREENNYSSVIVGFGEKKKIKKPLEGIYKNLGKFSVVKEFRIPEEYLDNFSVGEVLKVDLFSVGELVNITGLRKAKGFQGVVKRHGFGGGPKTHGQKDRLRHPGSIGGTNPQRVIKGRKMAGKISPLRVTIKNLEIVDILPEQNLLVVKGGVPGVNKGLVEIRSNFLTNKGSLYISRKRLYIIKSQSQS